MFKTKSKEEAQKLQAALKAAKGQQTQQPYNIEEIFVDDYQHYPHDW